MTTTLVNLAFLASAMAYAAVLSKGIPEPTPFVPATSVQGPVPTAVAQLSFDLFKRKGDENDYTCGFVSGSSASPVTCANPTQTCATNTFGIHGCCDPAANTACTIATSCIASTAMAASCTDTACSSDEAVVKCTLSTAHECYQWHFVYDNMVMTQHGCAQKPFTSTAYHHTLDTNVPASLSNTIAAHQGEKETVTATATVTTREQVFVSSTSAVGKDTHDAATMSSSTRKTSLGAIIGATVGACVFSCFVAFVVVLVLRRRRSEHVQSQRQHQQQSLVEYHAVVYENAHKAWDQHRGIFTCEMEIHQGDVMVSGNENQLDMGIVEVDGRQRPVEAPTGEK